MLVKSPETAHIMAKIWRVDVVKSVPKLKTMSSFEMIRLPRNSRYPFTDWLDFRIRLPIRFSASETCLVAASWFRWMIRLLQIRLIIRGHGGSDLHRCNFEKHFERNRIPCHVCTEFTDILLFKLPLNLPYNSF